MRLSSTFRKVSEQFNIEFGELAQEISHNQAAGEARENALRRLLQKYLPRRVGIDRGFVVDAHGQNSRQTDLVLYDSAVGTVFDVNGSKHFPCETVIAVGEVKSDITSAAKLQDALEKIKSVKELDRSNNGRNLIISGPGVSLQGLQFQPMKNHRDQIFGFIFTSASLRKDTLIRHLQEYNKRTDRRYWLNVFCDYSRLLISYQCPLGLCSSAMQATCLYCTDDSEVADLLLLFYTILATFVDRAHVARPDYFSYADIAETSATHHDLVV